MLIIHRKSIMLMHRPQTSQPGFGSITLLQKFTPHFKILDPRLLAPRNTRCHIRCFRAQGGQSSRYGTWYSVRVILQFMCVGSLASVTYLRYTVLTCSNKSETAVHCCDHAVTKIVLFCVANGGFVELWGKSMNYSSCSCERNDTFVGD